MIYIYECRGEWELVFAMARSIEQCICEVRFGWRGVMVWTWGFRAVFGFV